MLDFCVRERTGLHCCRPATDSDIRRLPRFALAGRCARVSVCPLRSSRGAGLTLKIPANWWTAYNSAKFVHPYPKEGQCRLASAHGSGITKSPPNSGCSHVVIATFEPLCGKETVEVLGWQKHVFAVCG